MGVIKGSTAPRLNRFAALSACDGGLAAAAYAPGGVAAGLKRDVLGPLAATASVMLTTPVGRKTLVKNISLFNDNPALSLDVVITSSGIGNITTALPIPAQSRISLDINYVMQGNETLGFSASTAGWVYASVTHVDVPSSEDVHRFFVGGNVTTAATWTTVYTAPSPMVMTCMMIGANGTISGNSITGLRVGTGNGYITSTVILEDKDLVVIDHPIPVASGAVVQAYTAQASVVAFTGSGYGGR